MVTKELRGGRSSYLPQGTPAEYTDPVRALAAVLWSVLVGLFAVVAIAEPLQFGMLGDTPAWTWMSPRMFAAERALGVQQARVDVVWADLQHSDGTFDFRISDNRFSAVAGSDGARPMQPFPTIYVGRGWMTCDLPCEHLFTSGTCERESPFCKPGCGCCQRCPGAPSLSEIPKDLSADADPNFAFSRTYYEFVQAFIDHYRDRLTYVTIESETDNASYWNTLRDPDGTLYLRLLATAYKAVKDTQPNIQVADSGLASNRLGLCIAKHRLEVEQRPDQEVFDFVRAYSASWGKAVDPPAQPPLASVGDLVGYLHAFADCAPLDNLVASESVDAWNFHYYESERTLDSVAQYFAARDAEHGRDARPLLTNQISCRPQASGDDNDEARCLFKNLIAVQALGVRSATWYGVSGQLGVVPWDEAGDERPAARAYRFVATTLGGGFAAPPGAQIGPALYRADFTDLSTGAAAAVALWSEDGSSHTVTLLQPPGYGEARIADYLGRVHAIVNPPAGTVDVDVATDPLLITWKRVILPCVGDCNGDGSVTIDELITGVNIALDNLTTDACGNFDSNGDGAVTIDELIQGVTVALGDVCTPI
ncbi:MAG: hypothetical protein HY270_02655 [Deltaproteobacteria bacterium]|nr:hypothetical protein [Deltaproteobacteria bacterium]